MRHSYWFLAVVVLAVVGFSVLGQTNAEAWWGSHEGNVKDNNNGQQGDILVHSGNVQGRYNDVGTWVDPSCIASLKGEKGDKGDRGERGYRGIKGDRGKRGYNGAKGDKGERGYRGYRGAKGDKGDDGKDGSDANVTHRYTKGAENKIANYGYNDFYSENAFKNNLINEGYSQVYDFLQEGLDLTAVGYYGRKADPNSYDVDYVLTEEYEKYSSQYQDIRIDKNKKSIKKNTKNITKNVRNINKNKKNIKKNTKEIKRVDKKHTKWNKKQDKKINKNTRKVRVNRKNIRKNTKEINRVDNRHTEWNEAQDIELNDHNNRIANNEGRINEHDNRISTLEDIQYNICGEVNLLQGRRHKLGAYSKFNINRTVISEAGLRITFDLDESWSVKELDRVNAKLDKLTAKLNNYNVETEMVQVSENKYTIQIKDKGKALQVINKW